MAATLEGVRRQVDPATFAGLLPGVPVDRVASGGQVGQGAPQSQLGVDLALLGGCPARVAGAAVCALAAQRGQHGGRSDFNEAAAAGRLEAMQGSVKTHRRLHLLRPVGGASTGLV